MKEFKRMIYRKNQMSVTPIQPIENCYFLEEIQFTDTLEPQSNLLSYEFIKCPIGFESNSNLTSGLYPINLCLDIETIILTLSQGTVDSTITILQVENAITTNSGNINRNILDLGDVIGSIRLKFSYCT